ncbi:hypothetical protein H0I76_08000 [Limibaculum sp. M0105]|uniref:Uncharacterized protein n=1 Tax=Thermohalobaculum xanthum TaxID=2753746 RepID=A0A8J7M778_9RHOB|nr:hypothetical protein [Thermohalobaculum xanthum]MBK0399127.1 hypothetical protein [Thermohalobaculum xanthum]
MADFKKAPTERDDGSAVGVVVPEWPDFLPEPATMLVHVISALVLLMVIYAGLRAVRAIARDQAEDEPDDPSGTKPKKRRRRSFWPPPPQTFEPPPEKRRKRPHLFRSSSARRAKPGEAPASKDRDSDKAATRPDTSDDDS